jgi:phospholipase/carboxylesterase
MTPDPKPLPADRPHDLLLHRPDGPSTRLFLLHHGAGAGPDTMARLGLRLAGACPEALVVSVAAPDRGGDPGGRCWYVSRSLPEAERIRRVATVLPEFIAVNEAWQQWSGLSGAETVLVGFSQGAILSLEAARARPGLAGRVMAFGGRFAELPAAPLAPTVVHLFHGGSDPVIGCRHSVAAAERLESLGSPVTLDLRPGLGHGLDEPLIATALSRLAAAPPL